MLRSCPYSLLSTLLCPPQSRLYAEALHPNVTIFGSRAFKRQLKLSEFISMGSWSNTIGVLTRDSRELVLSLSSTPIPRTHTKERPCEDKARKWPCTSQEESPHQKLKLLQFWFWTSSLQNWEKVNFYWWSHLSDQWYFTSSLMRLNHLLSPISHFPFSFEPSSICVSTLSLHPNGFLQHHQLSSIYKSLYSVLSIWQNIHHWNAFSVGFQITHSL